MADTSSNPRDVPVTTLRAIRAAGDRIKKGAESKTPQNEAITQTIDPITEARLLNSYHRAIRLIENETAQSSPNVLVTVQDRAASLLQSKLSKDETRASRFMPAASRRSSATARAVETCGAGS